METKDKLTSSPFSKRDEKRSTPSPHCSFLSAEHAFGISLEQHSTSKQPLAAGHHHTVTNTAQPTRETRFSAAPPVSHESCLPRADASGSQSLLVPSAAPPASTVRRLHSVSKGRMFLRINTFAVDVYCSCIRLFHRSGHPARESVLYIVWRAFVVFMARSLATILVYAS